MTNMTIKQKQKIEKALSEIILYYPAFSYVIFNWDMEETDKYDTMATNYKKLLYNPKFVDSLPMENLIAVILHEILHCVFLHPTEISRIQSEGKDFQCWTIALEIVVNAAVRDLTISKKYELPGNPFSPFKNESPPPPVYYYDPIGHNHTAPEIYEKLLQEKPNISCPWPMIVFCNDGNGGSDSQCGTQKGEKENTEKDTSQTNAGTITIDILPAEKGEFPEAVERAIATLEKLQKQIGYLPGGLSRQLNKLTKGKVPWKRVLHSFVATIKAGMDDYSWNRPDFKRSNEIIYPGLIEYDIDNIVVVIDTSGSISHSQQELQRFASEIVSLTHYTDEILLITTDAEVHEKIKVRNAKDLINKVKFTGGGGTDFRPIFKNIKKCESMVFFTDGYATYPDSAPSYPVLWVLTKDNRMPPFGKVAYMLDE